MTGKLQMGLETPGLEVEQFCLIDMCQLEPEGVKNPTSSSKSKNLKTV